MMKNTELFYSKAKNKYFWIGERVCSKCGKIIKQPDAWLLWDYWKTHFRSVIYCPSCSDEVHKAGGKYQEVKRISFEDSFLDLPEDAYLCIPTKPVMANSSNLSTFEVATTNIEGEEVMDDATQSHNPDFMIDHSSKSQEQLIAEMNDLKLLPDNRKASDDIINDILSAVPVPQSLVGSSSVHTTNLNTQGETLLPISDQRLRDKKIIGGCEDVRDKDEDRRAI
jgi:hypothetical protein